MYDFNYLDYWMLSIHLSFLSIFEFQKLKKNGFWQDTLYNFIYLVLILLLYY